MTAKEAIKELQEAHDIMRSYDIDISESRLMTALNMAIKALRQEPKTGHWLYSGENGRDKWTCDNCFDFVRKPQKTCPNCGARMIETQEG